MPETDPCNCNVPHYQKEAYRDYAIKRILTLPDILTVRQFAVALNVDESTIYRWIDAEVIYAIRLPMLGEKQSYRIFRSEFARIIGLGLADLAGIEQDVLAIALAYKKLQSH